MSEPAKTVDAVVIGAGPNGLVAANLLADAGWQVLVLEAADQAGGAVRTDEFVPGFRSDRFNAFYPMAALSPVIEGLGLAGYGLHWRHAPAVLAHVLPDDRCAVLSRDVDVTAASLAAFAPADGDAWRAEFAAWQRIRTDLVTALCSPFPSVRAGLPLLRSHDSRLTIPRETRRFAGEGARSLLGGDPLCTDLGTGGWLLGMAAQDVGFPVPEGGAGRLSRALVDRLAARGGRIRCRQTVTKVLTASGRAVGVATEDGNLIRARHAVLATVPAPALFLGLVGADQLPDRLVTELRDVRPDHGAVQVDWALSGRIPWRNRAASGAGAVRLGGDLLGQMTTADPTRSPVGTESAWARTRVPHGHQWADSDLDAVADRIQDTVEQHAPGFTDRIIGRRVHGPCHTDTNRPVSGLGRADTPIDRLFLAHPGGAVHGAPGANAARAALARAGVGGAMYRALVRRALDLAYG